jgi:hypothetical protein
MAEVLRERLEQRYYQNAQQLRMSPWPDMDAADMGVCG